jgi:glycosyltransferase involved in cell wall biosynthesis
VKVLVWQWGRRGAGPRYAAELAAGLRAAGEVAVLSLSSQAEILRGASPPVCDLPFDTYDGLGGLLARLPALPFEVRPLARRLRACAPDVAICAMPGVLDGVMLLALRRAAVPYVVVVHDAAPHPGDDFPFQTALQRCLIRHAAGLVALTEHVAARLRALGLVGARPLLIAAHPPFTFGAPPPPPGTHGGRLRLLSFGRLLPYKGLDLLAEALQRLGPRDDIEVRIVGSGPDSAVLRALASMPSVRVENRWVPEAEVGEVIAWADALVLSHREASQSGVAAAAVAARRWVVATRVGGIAEQLEGEPLARLCAPDAASLAAAIEGLLRGPPPVGAPVDAKAAWAAIAGRLAADIEAALQPGAAARQP